MLTEAKKQLKRIYGYNNFRDGQEKIIELVLNRKDVLGIMPTGGGKSITYQIPALILPGITIVISPLISLMKDQVDGLLSNGISATYINSTLSHSEIKERMRKAERGEYRLIYVAPERLESFHLQALLFHQKISLIAIDEAHCISQWGHDFRPSYLQITSFIEGLNEKPIVLALTATATPAVKKDIIEMLNIPSKQIIQTGFARENLRFNVIKGVNKDRYMVDYIKENRDEAGIIYAATRKEVERIYKLLVNNNITAGKYHAGMTEHERQMNQEQFLYDQTAVMVATNAFGMGIDKSNVRFVIHYNIPKNIEAYYQEAGRAGRDGLTSYCTLLYSPQDVHIQRFFIEQSDMDEKLKEFEYRKLRSMVDYCNTESCYQAFIVQYFGDEVTQSCGTCMNCLDEKPLTDVTLDAQMVLSCIKRMREKFGKTMVAKVLTGSREQKIQELRLDQLPTFGLLKKQSQRDVNEFIDFLMAEGFIRPTDGAYPTLLLTQKGIDVLLGKSQVFRKKQPMIINTGVAENKELFDMLRSLRKTLASEERIPAYLIFSDETLKDMSIKLPRNHIDMLMIKGVGQKKLDLYGEQFIDVINKYIKGTS